MKGRMVGVIELVRVTLAKMVPLDLLVAGMLEESHPGQIVVVTVEGAMVELETVLALVVRVVTVVDEITGTDIVMF